jgi:ABC-2 type transport system ATP-binding protein/ribosome-dependent ATPase
MVDALAEARRTSKRFGAFLAVDVMDLVIARSEVVGLLGANGAGKTTLIRLLLGLLQPSGGTVRLFGAAPSVSTRRRVGYVPQTLGLYVDLTVAENWSFTAGAFRNVATAMPSGIAAWKHELVGALPLGAQRQVAFAVALSHRPELLVLDEPTSGVGPLGRARLWEEVRQAAERGAGVLVTTHNMEEAEECDRLIVMVDGRAVATGTATEIIGGRKVAEIHCADWSRARFRCGGRRCGRLGRWRPSAPCSRAPALAQPSRAYGPTLRRRSWPSSRSRRQCEPDRTPPGESKHPRRHLGRRTAAVCDSRL